MKSINTMKKLGVSIKRARKSAGLNQAELSKLTGLRQATISKIENSGTGNIETFMKILQALKITIDFNQNEGKDNIFISHSYKNPFQEIFQSESALKSIIDEHKLRNQKMQEALKNLGNWNTSNLSIYTSRKSSQGDDDEE